VVREPEATFGNRKASLVTTEDLNDYVIARHKAKAMNATNKPRNGVPPPSVQIGFEARPRLVAEVPTFPKKLPETARTGFIEDVAFGKLLAALKEPGLRAMVLTAYRLGFRMSELKNLLVLQIAGGWIILFAERRRTVKRGRFRCRRKCAKPWRLAVQGRTPRTTCSLGRTENRFSTSEVRG